MTFDVYKAGALVGVIDLATCEVTTHDIPLRTFLKRMCDEGIPTFANADVGEVLGDVEIKVPVSDESAGLLVIALDLEGYEAREIDVSLLPLSAPSGGNERSFTPESATITTLLRPLNEARFSEDEPRDPAGKWTSDGGEGSSEKPASEWTQTVKDTFSGKVTTYTNAKGEQVQVGRYKPIRGAGYLYIRHPDGKETKYSGPGDHQKNITAMLDKKYGIKRWFNPDKWLRQPGLRYSEDQPRDEHGRWGDGGAEAAPSKIDDRTRDDSPSGVKGTFSPEKGGTLFHGTNEPGRKPGEGEFYFAKEYGETIAFAQGEIPGTAGSGTKPSVMVYDVKPGKTLDVNAQFQDMVMNGDPTVDEPKIFNDAREQGARYVTFWHPSTVPGRDEFQAIVSLYPKEDVKSTGGWRLTKRWLRADAEFRYSEDQPRDEHGRFGEGGGLMSGGTDWKAGADEKGNIPVESIFAHPMVQMYPGEADDDQGVKDVSLDQLWPVQEDVGTKGVQGYIDKPSKAPIEVVKHKDRYYIADGHTRAAAAIVRGEKTIKAHVFAVVPMKRNLNPEMWLRKPDVRYSEDQPRDDHGRFSSGGGEGTQEKTPEAAPPVFETPKVEAPLGMYHMTGRGTDAKMAVLPGGQHMLQAGSKIVLEKGQSCPKAIAAKRDEYLANGTLLEREGYLITTQDIAFSSTSAAASFVLGTAASGPAEWKPEPGGKAIKSEEKPTGEKRPSQDIWKPSGVKEPAGTGEPTVPRVYGYDKSERLVERTKEALAELPATHLDGLMSVEFHNGKMTIAAPQGRVNNAIGVYNHAGKTIKVADYYGHASLGHLNNTVWHEVGHHVHLTKMTTDAAREWAALSKDGSTAKVSSYARTNTAEHFAEAYAAYRESKSGSGHAYKGKDLKWAEPKVHDFMARVFDPSSGMLKGNGRQVSTWIGSTRLHGAE